MLAPERQRVPLPGVKRNHQLRLAALGVGLRSEVGEVGVARGDVAGGERILKADLVPELTEAGVELEPLEGFLIPLKSERGGLALLPRVRIADEEGAGGNRQVHR